MTQNSQQISLLSDSCPSIDSCARFLFQSTWILSFHRTTPQPLGILRLLQGPAVTPRATPHLRLLLRPRGDSRAPGASGLVFLWAFAGNGLPCPPGWLHAPPSPRPVVTLCPWMSAGLRVHPPSLQIRRERLPGALCVLGAGGREKKPWCPPGTAHVLVDLEGGQAHVCGQVCKPRSTRAHEGLRRVGGNGGARLRCPDGRGLKIKS